MRIYVKMRIAVSPIHLRVAVVGNTFRTGSFPPLSPLFLGIARLWVSLNSRRNEIAKEVNNRHWSRVFCDRSGSLGTALAAECECWRQRLHEPKSVSHCLMLAPIA